MRLFHSLSKSKNKKFSLVIGLMFAVAGFMAFNTSSHITPVASAAVNCDGSGNSIMPSGTGNADSFIKQVRAKSELQHIYGDSRFGTGLSSGQYDNFARNAKPGYTDIDGSIHLKDGTKVGDGAGSIGRSAGCQGPSANVKTFNIPGAGTYYGSANTYSINHNTPQLDILVLLDANGKAVFAVITNCGNPLYFPPPPPIQPQAAVCSSLNVVADKANPQDYTFTTTAPVSGGASISYVVYDFGDNSMSSHVSPGKVVAHTYNSGGAYTVTTTVHAVKNGNPVTIKPAGNCIQKFTVPKPNYLCVNLVQAVKDQSTNTYVLTVNADYGSGVSSNITADFDFGDNTSHKNGVRLSGKSASVTHKYTLTSLQHQHSFTATAILHFTVYGVAKSRACTAQVPVSVPYCSGLSGQVLDNEKDLIEFTATAVPYGRKLDSAKFVFGDGSKQTVNATTPTTVVVQHDYPSGTYNASATLRFTGIGGDVTSVSCLAVCKPNAPNCVSECKPNVPVGDVQCNPCPSNPSYPADDTVHCVVPETSLPNTGAGDTIAIFSAVVIGGFLVYRQLLFRQHKAAFVAAEQGTSLLPLADPLNDEAPLQDTPLAPKRSTFRRKRPF